MDKSSDVVDVSQPVLSDKPTDFFLRRSECQLSFFNMSIGANRHTTEIALIAQQDTENNNSDTFDFRTSGYHPFLKIP